MSRVLRLVVCGLLAHDSCLRAMFCRTGPGRDALPSVLETIDQGLASCTTGAWLMVSEPYDTVADYPMYYVSASPEGPVSSDVAAWCAVRVPPHRLMFLGDS